MQFASLTFFAFFVITLTLSWLTQGRLRKFILVLASYVFYLQIGIAPLVLLIMSTTFNYLCGNGIRLGSRKNATRWLMAGVGFNIGLLFVYKYSIFFRASAENLAIFLGTEVHLGILEMILPIGISFYTFQAISYLIDIYRGHGPYAKTFVDFALFQNFFPQILIGPICRSSDLLPQIENMPTTKIHNQSEAFLLILSGLWKKVILATLLHEYGVADSFAEPERYSSLALWLSMFGYSVQLYCDFSGYTDMARGFSLLMGFQLPTNFQKPYAATNLGDFWKRWHITYSRWLRDYIYIPLGGSKGTSNQTSLNLFITFAICGFWHGATWGFVLWGCIHGIGLAAHKRHRDIRRSKGLPPIETTKQEIIFGWLYTFLFVCLSRVVFQTPDLASSFVFYERMIVPSTGSGISFIIIPCILLGMQLHFWTPFDDILTGIENFQKHSKFQRQSLILFSVVFLLSFILLLRPSGIPPYLYFRF